MPDRLKGVRAGAEKTRAALPADLQPFLADMAAGRAVDEVTAAGSALHMDRPHPYLCLHRRSGTERDQCTDRLLAGLGAALVLPNPTVEFDSHQALIDALAAMAVEKFGAFLLLEVWARLSDMKAEETGKRINFHIHTSKHGVDPAALEALEAALLDQDWHGFAPACAVSYRDRPAPRGLDSLMSTIAADGEKRFYLGLEVDAIYRDPESGSLRPQMLRTIAGDFTHCVKQALFAFARARSTRKPKHYHQLGSQLITNAALEADAGLTRIGKSFDLVLFATPVNVSLAWHDFQDSSFRKAPEFHYRPLTVSTGALKRDLYKAPVDRVEDPALHFIFDERRQELDRQITMLGDRSTPNFLLGSQQVYPPPGSALVETAHQILRAVDPPRANARRPAVSAETLAAAAREMLHSMKSREPVHARVEVRDDLPGIMVSDGNLLIGRQAMFAEDRVAPVLNHEIGTHVLTHHNGAAQPFLHLQAGLAGYQALQEGIAVAAEYLSGGLGPARLRQIAARVLAVHAVVTGAEFIDTFRMLTQDHGFEPATAFQTSMRVHRSGGFTKDSVYLQGLIELLALLRNGESLEDLLVGKFATAHLDIIRELRWRGILRPCSALPPYLADGKAQDRLKRLSHMEDILDLMER